MQFFNNPSLTTTVFVVLMAIWLPIAYYMRHELKKVKEKTTELVLEAAKKLPKNHPKPTVADFYASIYPSWEEMVRTNIRWFPHSSDIFPVRARPEIVRERIRFNPETVDLFLASNGIRLSDSKVELENEPQPSKR